MLTDTPASRPPQQEPAVASPSTLAHDPSPAGAGELFIRLAALDDSPERNVVRGELAALWLPMAYRIAGRFRDRGEDLEDLRQVAALGLVKAIDRYDAGRGVAFESYAIPTITGEVKRHFRDRMWAVRVPRGVQELRNRVRLARRDLIQRPGSAEPSLAELAACAGCTEEEAGRGLEALNSFSALSLDAELVAGNSGCSLTESLGETDPAYQVAVDREAVKDALRRLPARQREILYLRFFEDMTQSRIAERFGVSQMHVSRLLARSCTQVRKEVMGSARHARTAA
ncbi:SigB/SigF/SigG family RNA polymerase sigma factor [Streptomyces sp. NPDC102487]|uniref:SigB/SigF/SigG family RNA polymerase sigma factor n=1 Tax=Streptomyces sp. NPDC102487 TaxID=3366182 RepID=UPI00382C12BD